MRKLSFDLYSACNQKLIDACIAGISFYFAYQMVFDGSVPAAPALQMWALLPAIMLGQVAANALLRTYRMIWKYVGLHDAIRLALNYASLPVLLVLLHYAIPSSTELLRVPLGVILLQYLFSVAGAMSARVARRLHYERTTAHAIGGKTASPVLLIGAGRAGVKIATDLVAQGSLHPLGFLDDDPKKSGTVVAGLRVLGPVSLLSSVVEKHAVEQVIVCIASPGREMLRRIWATCETFGIPVKVVPTLEQILNGKTNTARVRDLEMNDLLGRNPIPSSAVEFGLTPIYQGKRILVTGAGGSIGSELGLQLSRLKPAELLLLDKDENGLNDTYLHVNNCKATPLIADIRFPERLRTVFETHRAEIVFHAAAHKHVHLMETNPCEAITNNVTGTRNLVEQSIASGVARFIQVSTDKAVVPTSVMGASKRVCEMIVQTQNHANTRFCCVRFGNVLGSRGSVVPIFREQILRGGPVTVTHPDAQRFLMTIPEAVCLLLQAGALAADREIFVLDMGEPVSVHKLAQDLIELSGLSPNRDVKIEITGLKRGEKLSEVLLDTSSETLQPTRFDKIQTITTKPFDSAAFAHKLRALERSAWENSAEEIYLNLAGLNIGYNYEAPARPWPMSARRPTASVSVAKTFAPELR